MTLMESNITKHQYSDGDSILPQPHFDEEATLLSARPVVSLQEIKAGERSGRRLAFGAALVFSLLVGALGASFVYKQRGQKQATAIVDTAIPGAEGITVEKSVPEPVLAESAGELTSGGLREAKPVNDKESVSSGTFAGELSKLEAKRKRPIHQAAENELRRAERIEERRFRRGSEGQARVETRGRKVTDGLLRIREIFVGPPRP
jgi:hypothetical protein